MKNAEYWRERFLILEAASHEEGEAYLRNLENQFRQATASIQGDMERWYARFAKNNGITLAEAKRWMTSKELAEFRWSVEDYIKYGQENALNGQWMKQLENASARVHISRLESLQVQMQQQIEVLYGNHLDDLDALLRDVYSDGYYHTAFEIQKGVNVGWDLQSLNTRQLDAVLTRPWSTDMRTFRDRCWTNKAELVNTVQTQLTQSIIRGDNPQKAIKHIADRFQVSRKKAGRLVMTESAYFSSQAQKDCFNELDVEKFQILATLDNRTSVICQELDGKVFRMADYEPGVTAPPFHPWCRTTTIPYFEDNDGERFARDADAKGYYVPADMKYPEWKEAFVEGGLAKSARSGIIKKGKPKDFFVEKVIPVEKTTIRAEPNSITQAVNKKGGIDRNFYGPDGKQTKQICNNDHGTPKHHPYGQHGEHAHDYIWDGDLLIDRPTRDLTEIERKENNDIL